MAWQTVLPTQLPRTASPSAAAKVSWSRSAVRRAGSWLGSRQASLPLI